MKLIPILSQLILAVSVIAPRPITINPSDYNTKRIEPPVRNPPVDADRYHKYMDDIEKEEPVKQSKSYLLPRMGMKGDRRSGWVVTDVQIGGLRLRVIDVALSIEHPQSARCVLFHNDQFPAYTDTVWDVTPNSKYSELQRKGFLHQSWSFSPRRLTREEYPPAMMKRGFDVVAAPQTYSEAQATSKLWSEVADYARLNNFPVRIRQVLSNAEIKYAREKFQPYIGPAEPVGNYPPPVYQTTNAGYYYRPREDPLDTQGRYGGPARRRRDILSMIETPGSDPATNEAAIEQVLLSAYESTQSNITQTIWPYMMALMDAAHNTTGSDALILQAMALSLFQLTSPNMFIMGPFMMGATSMNWGLDQLAKNVSKNSTEYQETAAYCGATAQLYGDIWGNVSAIANSTGELSQLQLLADAGSQLNGSTSAQSNIPDHDGFILSTLDALFGYNGTNGTWQGKI